MAVASLGLVSAPLALLATAPAQASGSAGLVISEAYGGGGNAGATLRNDFVELYNPTDAPISVNNMSVQYRSSGSTTAPSASGVTALSGSVPAKGHFLVAEAAGTGGTTDLPTPDVTGSTAMSGTAFTVYLVDGTSPVNPGTGSGVSGVVDLLGAASNTYEGTVGPAPSNTTSDSRSAAGTDTDDNGADFTTGAPSPTNASGATTGGGTGGGGGGGGTGGTPVTKTIAEIQGDNTDTSPLNGTLVTTTGVVTAAYPTGGLSGFDIQTGGPDTTPNASDGVFVYAGSKLTAQQYPSLGQTVTVTGTVSEYKPTSAATPRTLTELNITGPGDVVQATTAQPAVVAVTDVPGTDCALPGTACPDAGAVDAAREKVESELIQPSGDYTVTDDYDGSPSPSTSSSDFGEIGLAAHQSTPLLSPTEVVDADDTAGLAARTLYNTDHEINIDDGASISITSSSNTDVPYPWLSKTHDVRVGSAVTFTKPVVLSYGNDEWKLEPQAQVTGTGAGVVDFSDTRSQYAAGPADVGGSLKFATFNVLNYFPTTGEAYVAAGGGNACTYYNDRAGNPITTKNCGNPSASSGNGPRGAADQASFERQQAKIVHAINALGANIVSLEEIENSVKFGKDRDYGVSTLVNALNADAGAGTWAYVPSPATLPATADQDVIRTAFIYQPAAVALVGGSEVLSDMSGAGQVYSNAREPLAQAFKKVGDPDSAAFGIVVNHLKSKGDDGSSPATGDNATGIQGAYNGDRVRQADATMAFADQFKADRGISAMFLAGDFNAYSHEDPVREIEAHGYTALDDSVGTVNQTYNFGGTNGSLDHVFANAAALPTVSNADVWPINAYESVYYEYSRYNYNVNDLYDTTPFRASDHNPEIVGITPADTTPPPVLATPNVRVKAPQKVAKGDTARVRVSVTGTAGPAEGEVRITYLGNVVRLTLRHGKAQFTTGRLRDPGTFVIRAAYPGGDTYGRGSDSTSVTVTKPKHGHHRR